MICANCHAPIPPANTPWSGIACMCANRSPVQYVNYSATGGLSGMAESMKDDKIIDLLERILEELKHIRKFG